MTIYGIAGASSALGQFVLHSLLKNDIPPSQIVLLARKKANVQLSLDLFPELSFRYIDYNDIDHLKIAFMGITHLLLISTSDLISPLQQHRNMVASIDTSSIRHVFYTSLVNTDKNAIRAFNEWHQETERLILASSKEYNYDYTIIRNGWYAENWFLSTIVKEVVKNGSLVACCGQAPVQVATRSDLGAAIGIIMSQYSRYSNRVVTLVSPEVFSMHDAAIEIAKQSGTNIVYKPVTETELVDYLVSTGIDRSMASAMADWEVDVAKGALIHSSTELQDILGRPPQTLHEIIEYALSQ